MEKLSVNDRLDVMEFRRKRMENPPELELRLYRGCSRRNNSQTVQEIIDEYDQARHAILDEMGIPKQRNECSVEELAAIDDPNKKVRNSSIAGSSFGPLEILIAECLPEGEYLVYPVNIEDRGAEPLQTDGPFNMTISFDFDLYKEQQNGSVQTSQETSR